MLTALRFVATAWLVVGGGLSWGVARAGEAEEVVGASVDTASPAGDEATPVDSADIAADAVQEVPGMGDPPDPFAMLAVPDPTVSDGSTLTIGVFGSVDLQLYSEEDEQVAAVGLTTLDIFFASRAWEKVYAMADVVFEEDDNAFAFIIDRYLVRYDWAQYLQLGIGQVHNPLIQWNRRVSHGLYLQTPISRPKFLDREVDQGIWPTHLLGVTANGEIPGWGLGYFVGIANGRGTELDQPQIREDENFHKAVVANLNYLPFADGRLRLDASFYMDLIPAEPQELNEFDYALSVQFEDSSWELRAEASLLTLAGVDSTLRAEVWGGYLLLAHKFNTSLGEIRPYLMSSHVLIGDVFERIEYFAPTEVTEDENNYLLGVRWEPAIGLAVKLEYVYIVETSHDVTLQFAFSY